MSGLFQPDAVAELSALEEKTRRAEEGAAAARARARAEELLAKPLAELAAESPRRLEERRCGRGCKTNDRHKVVHTQCHETKRWLLGVCLTCQVESLLQLVRRQRGRHLVEDEGSWRDMATRGAARRHGVDGGGGGCRGGGGCTGGACCVSGAGAAAIPGLESDRKIQPEELP